MRKGFWNLIFLNGRMMILMLMEEATILLIPPSLSVVLSISQVFNNVSDVVHGVFGILVGVDEVGLRIFDGENFFHII